MRFHPGRDVFAHRNYVGDLVVFIGAHGNLAY